MRTELLDSTLCWLIGVCLVAAGRLMAQEAVAPSPSLLPPLNAVPVENTQLLINAGFEEPDKGWRFSDWPPRAGTSDKLIAASIVYSPDADPVPTGDWTVRAMTGNNAVAQIVFSAISVVILGRHYH